MAAVIVTDHVGVATVVDQRQTSESGGTDLILQIWLLRFMKLKQNDGDNDFDDVDDHNYLTNIYFDLDAVFDTSRRHLQLIEGVRVAR